MCTPLLKGFTLLQILLFLQNSFILPQALLSLSSEQQTVPGSLSSAFPPVSKSTHSGGINVNAAPFQSVQAVCYDLYLSLLTIQPSFLKGCTFFTFLFVLVQIFKHKTHSCHWVLCAPIVPHSSKICPLSHTVCFNVVHL